MDFDGDYSFLSSKSNKPVLRKSVRSTLTCWKGHKLMLLEKTTFQCASSLCAPLLSSALAIAQRQ